MSDHLLPSVLLGFGCRCCEVTWVQARVVRSSATSAVRALMQLFNSDTCLAVVALKQNEQTYGLSSVMALYLAGVADEQVET